MRNKILVILGYLFLLVGIIGIFVPIMPTTPFLILSITCLSSKPKLQQKLKSNKYIREYFNHYENNTSVSAYTIIKSLVLMWIMLIASIVVINYNFISNILMFIGFSVTIHLLWIYLKPKYLFRKRDYVKTKTSDTKYY